MVIQYKMRKKSNIMPQENDKSCQVNKRPLQSKVCADKKCQASKCYKKINQNCQTSDMQPEMPEMNKQLPKPPVQKIKQGQELSSYSM